MRVYDTPEKSFQTEKKKDCHLYSTRSARVSLTLNLTTLAFNKENPSDFRFNESDPSNPIDPVVGLKKKEKFNRETLYDRKARHYIKKEKRKLLRRSKFFPRLAPPTDRLLKSSPSNRSFTKVKRSVRRAVRVPLTDDF